MSEKGAPVDLSKFTNGQIRDLYWALYDLNATILKLMDAGLADHKGTVNIDETMSKLEAELRVRRMTKKTAQQKEQILMVQTFEDVQPPEDKIGADF